jgi:hypothetical protein
MHKINKKELRDPKLFFVAEQDAPGAKFKQTSKSQTTKSFVIRGFFLWLNNMLQGQNETGYAKANNNDLPDPGLFSTGDQHAGVKTAPAGPL